ncbi:hypothetical protein EJB05_18282, partial [Eragrostis curvula]
MAEVEQPQQDVKLFNRWTFEDVQTLTMAKNMLNQQGEKTELELRDRLNTRNLLRRKNMSLPDYTCVLCTGQVEETLIHLFFECPFSVWCWRFVNISWNTALQPQDMIIRSRRRFGSKIFREIIMVVAWSIWCHRNSIIFDGAALSLGRWKNFFKEEFALILHKAKPSTRDLLEAWLIQSEPCEAHWSALNLHSVVPAAVSLANRALRARKQRTRDPQAPNTIEQSAQKNFENSGETSESSKTLAMASEAEGDPRAWVAVDETAAAFLSRSLATRPPIILPPPLHRAPLRPGNVVEIACPSNSGKTNLLLTAAVQCILPKEWEGIYFGGLGKAVMFFDLDCRFDVLRLAQMLRSRIAEGRSSAHPRNEELGKDGTKDSFNCSFEDTLFSDCMQRFLYVRCYSSSEFITVESQLRSGVLGASVYFLMIDSIGAFYWMDRGSQPARESKGKSLQSITETVVQEIRNVLQLQPALVMVTKSPIYGEGTTSMNDFNRASSLYMLEDSTVMRYSRQEDERNLASREYMPPLWQSFVTHRIKLQVEEAEVLSVRENDAPSMHTSEWVQPSLKTKEKFSISNISFFGNWVRWCHVPTLCIMSPHGAMLQ